MNLGTITQTGAELKKSILEMPYQFSENPSITFIKDALYADYVSVACVGYFDGKKMTALTIPIIDGEFKLPHEVFENSGNLVISIALSNGDETIVASGVKLNIREAPGITDILPDHVATWQSIVIAFLEEYIRLNVTDRLENLIKANKELNATAAELEHDINVAIDNCGQYIFEDGTIKFKQADGTFGNPILIPGQTSMYVDDVAIPVVKLSTSRSNLNCVKVQLQDFQGVPYYVETSADMIFISEDLKLNEVLGGNLFKISESEEEVTFGNFDEWIQAGKPKA